MNCRKCGTPLPSEGALCKFCGTLMTPEEINERNSLREPNSMNKINLLSDKYNVDKSVIYTEKPKERKLLGLIIIVVILLFLIILAILLNGGK